MANHTNWLNISSMSGSSGQTILTLSANKNLSTNYKTAEITAYNPVYNISAKTYVTLEAYSPILSISPSIVGIPASGGTYELHISANCGWVIAFPDIVTSYSTSASSGDAVVTFTVPNTICASTLVGNIVVTDDSGQISRTCRVEQYGEGVHISVSPTAVTLPYYGGSEVFTVTADCVYSVEKGSGQWYSLSSNSGYTGSTQFTVSGASTNSGNTDWTDSITIIGPDGTAATISVTQLNWWEYHFNYTADTSTIDYSGETRTITIDTTDAINSSITIEIIGAPDVTYSYSTSGLSRGIITLNVPQNPGGERHFKVIVTGRRALSQNNSTAVIEYTQEALRLEFTTDTSNVKGIGETRTITILNTNINPNRTGLNLPSDFPQQGSYTVVGNTIYLTYPRNPSSSATRTWTIGVVAQTNDGVSLSGSYTITQDANLTYSIPYTADTSTVDATGETRTITIDTSNLVVSSITIGVEGATGVTYTYENGVITVTFPANSGDSLDGQRNVVVTITGETLDGKEAYAAITYTQDYEYTGEKRLFIIYEVGDQNTFRSIIYGHTAWAKVSKVELANGTDITNDIVFCGDSESPQWGYNFGVGGFYGLYFTFLNNAIPAYAFDQIGNIRLIVVPDTITTIEDEAFDGTDSPIISFGKGLEEVHRKILQFSSIQKIIFNSQTAPVIPQYIVDSYSNLFYGVPSGGTMFYPCGSDYSNYTNVLENEHSWNSVCFTESGVPSSSYTYQAYLLGDLSVVNISGETRTFNVGGLLDDSSTYYFDVVGPTGTTYTTSGGTITVTIPQCQASVENEIYMEVTATSYNGLFLGTGRTVLTQKEVIEPVMPLTFVVESGGTILWKTSSYNMTGRPIKYRINNGSWTTITSTTADSASFRVSPGDIVEIAGDNTRYGYDYQYYNFFSASSGCKFSVKGNIMSLLNSTGFSEMTTFTTGNVFSNLFKDCQAITSAEKLLLPATTLTTSCYESMFKGCSNMTIAPKLPAETLYNGCYNTMFSGCTNLSSITCYATNVSTAYTDYWVNGVSIVGTFTTPSTTQWTTGVSGIPSGWTRVNSDT